MIKLTRPPKPLELTTDKQAELTNIFKTNGDSVWNKSYIKDTLFNMSHGKCCYCECNISEESKYMEVEHFHPKDKYKDEVVEWDNLLPSCKKCNGTKNDHDTVLEPIINPAVDIPNEHLYMHCYRLYGKDTLGKKTVEVLYLNDSDRLVTPRFKIGEEIQETVVTLYEKARDYSSEKKRTTYARNQIIGGTKKLLKEAQPSSEYSAIVSTILLTDPNYLRLKPLMINLNLWDSEHQSLENIAKEHAFQNK